MQPADSTQKKPLKRKFNVTLHENEAANLRNYKTEKAGRNFLRGEPRLIRKSNGTYVAKIFRSFPLLKGSYTALAKIKFVNDQTLKVVIKSGSLWIGYFMLILMVLVVGFSLLVLKYPDLSDGSRSLIDIVLLDALIIAVFSFLAWTFLSRYMRESDIDKMEEYLKAKISGEWHIES